MNYLNLVRPLIGAGIGYITNWIAVKMLFRPLNPVKIGKLTLPFTPGIIPKNKSRIAGAIGDTINNNLLTEDAIAKHLLSEDSEKLIREKIKNKLEELGKNDTSIKENILDLVESDTYESVITFINSSVSKAIVNLLIEENIGEIIAKQIEDAANEKIQCSILGILGGNSIISNISQGAAIKINEYIEKNGDELVSNMIAKKITELENMKVSDAAKKIDTCEIDVVSIIVSVYKKIIKENLSKILKAVDISKIVTDKINEMDMLELEEMILTIMKKELNALVNLGALIGFLLGLINLAF